MIPYRIVAAVLGYFDVERQSVGVVLIIFFSLFCYNRQRNNIKQSMNIALVIQ
jgi:hypothetical protein